MKINFDSIVHKAKEIALGTVATVVTVTGSPDIQGAEKKVEGKNVHNIDMLAPAPKDATKDANTYVSNNKEGNESKEKMANLEIAKDAILHAGQGGYTSDKMPGFVFISEKDIPSHGGGSLSYGIRYKINAYKVSDGLMNGYFIYDIGIDGDEKESGGDVLKHLNEVGTHVDSRLNPTNPIDISFVYNRLREKMNPQEIQKILETANPRLNVDILIAALESNTSYDLNEKNKMKADILTLRKAPSKNEKKLNEQKLADTGK